MPVNLPVKVLCSPFPVAFPSTGSLKFHELPGVHSVWHEFFTSQCAVPNRGRPSHQPPLQTDSQMCHLPKVTQLVGVRHRFCTQNHVGWLALPPRDPSCLHLPAVCILSALPNLPQARPLVCYRRPDCGPLACPLQQRPLEASGFLRTAWV